MTTHPQISALYKIYTEETKSPFRKVHRMIDLFESIIKTHTIVILAEYFKRNELSDAVKGLLAVGLRTPSLGTWQLFSREIFKELNTAQHTFLLIDFTKEFQALDKALNDQKTNVISFRNGYAHGATPSDDDCEKDIKQFHPFLERLLQSSWLSNSDVIEKDGKAILISLQDKQELSLYPLLISKAEQGAQPFAFFNDLKDDKVGLLNYPLSKHYREKEFFKEFHNYLPLKDWKKTGSSEFNHRIEELTETFKGRIAEREKIRQFVITKNNGYFSIQGNPGIGKSALIAQVYIDLTRGDLKIPISLTPYFIRRGTAQADSLFLLNYLIKTTDHYFSEGKNITAEGKTNWDLQQQLFTKWRAYGESDNKNKLVFLIDGLDEGVEKDILQYLPRENFSKVLVIYGSRPGGAKALESFWGELPVEHHTSLLLSGLSKNDIRALLYEVGNKYEIEKDSAWIDTIEKRSEGNPLYLKLLCNAIENGSIQLNDPTALPKEINEYYKAILDRYANNETDGDALLNSLFVFAAAADYLTPAHLSIMNGFGAAQTQRVESTLKEVLYENPLTEDVLDYQLFHESFRQYLVREKAHEVSSATSRIIAFCERWKEHEGSWEQRYALEHWAAHLFESKRDEDTHTLERLIFDPEYPVVQQKVLRGFNASNRLYKLGLLKAAECKHDEAMIEAALRLVDLKYEAANDAKQVVEMVANGEIDMALTRIESFGGNDSEGLKRKFILYMLCLMELTLLDGKDKPHARDGCKKLFKHLDEHIPVDHSLLRWNDFFSSLLMYKMACVGDSMGLDYMVVFKRNDSWDFDWLNENDFHNEISIEVLQEAVKGCGALDQGTALKLISLELARKGKVSEAVNVAYSLNDEYSDKHEMLLAIATELALTGKMTEAVEVAQNLSGEASALSVISIELARQGKVSEALETVQGIIDEDEKCMTLSAITNELKKQCGITEVTEVSQRIDDLLTQAYLIPFIPGDLARQGRLTEALEMAHGLSFEGEKSSALAIISVELTRQGMVSEAIEAARDISDEDDKTFALSAISLEWARQGKVSEAIEAVRDISDEDKQNLALSAISFELSRQGKVSEAKEAAHDISDEYDRSLALSAIPLELARSGKLAEALQIVNGIDSSIERHEALLKISVELARLGRFSEAMETARSIDFESTKARALSGISGELVHQGRLDEASSVLSEHLEIKKTVSNGFKTKLLSVLSVELVQYGKVTEALKTVQAINDESAKVRALSLISEKIYRKGDLVENSVVINETLKIARGIQGEHERIWALSVISEELSRQGRAADAYNTLTDLLHETHGITDKGKSLILSFVAAELVRQGKVSEALETANGISNESEKSVISKELARKGEFSAALEYARSIAASNTQAQALSHISVEFARQCRSSEALEIARSIREEGLGFWKLSALTIIAAEFAKQGNWELAKQTGNEIHRTNRWQSCWQTMADTMVKSSGWEKAILAANNLNDSESVFFYLKGLARSLSPANADSGTIIRVLPKFLEDLESIESLLQAHALHELFFGSASSIKIDRLNRTLDIQWAIDIAEQFPKEASKQRLSTNLEGWMNEISDEDDREQIQLWARQVAKGRMTEQEFGGKVKGMGRS